MCIQLHRVKRLSLKTEGFVISHAKLDPYQNNLLYKYIAHTIIITVILIEICKAPTLHLKALNNHSITHIMYIEMENVISNKFKKTFFSFFKHTKT